MNLLERLFAQSPWWTEPKWEAGDRSLKNVRSSGFSFRHLGPEFHGPENLRPGSVSIVRGPRQVGKTTELKLLVRDLISAGVNPQNIAYYPCDDIIHFRELTDLINTFVQAVRLRGGTGYLLIDEISAVKNWTRSIKSLTDSGSLEDIYLNIVKQSEGEACVLIT